MRLFVFFAYRFLKWAGLSEHPDPPVANSEHNLAESEPPEHWRRLVSKGPPKHWLDLFRYKSVETTVVLNEHQEAVRVNTSTNPPEFQANTGSKTSVRPEFIGVQRHRRNVATYSDSQRHAWLNRLRFFPAPLHTESGLNIPPPGEQTKSLPDYVRSGTAKKISYPRFVTRRISFHASRAAQRAELDARVDKETNNQANYVANRLAGSDAPSNYQRRPAKTFLQPASYVLADSAGRENDLTFASPISRASEDGNATIFDESPRANGNALEPNYVSSRRTDRRSSLQLNAHVSTSVNELDGLFAEPPAREAALEQVEHEYVAEVRDATTFVEWPRLLQKNQFNEIESRRRETPPLICVDDSSNRWPRLPDRPVFEIADEFFARRDEFDARQRLEREQSGNRWNE